MVTSSITARGKSTTSSLLLYCQQMGKSAIIVDYDLRLPAQSKSWV
jgi:Mrp family chromosome partitioning ATPase